MDNKLFLRDYARFTQDSSTSIEGLKCRLRLIKNYELRILWVLRKYQAAVATCKPFGWSF